MGTVNINLAEAQNLNLPLGLQLENEVTEVVFDFSAWKTAYGSGDLGLSIQRPGDSQPYAGELTIDGTDATWTVSSLAIAYKGVGEIQLTYTVGTVVKKSVIYKFTVYKSLGANGEYPSPGQTWQEEIEDELADVKADLGDLDELETTDKSSLVDAINEVAQGGGGSGITDEVRSALLACFRHIAFLDDDDDYYGDLYDALYAVTAISLNTNSLSFTSLNTTQQLTATTVPVGGDVTWLSSDTSIATVSSSGLVTAKGYGSATITATSGSVSATCSVVVSQATLTSISAVYTQSGTVYDTDSLDSLKSDLVVTATWSDSSTSTVSASDYTLSGTLVAGTSTITVSYGGKTDTFDVTVTEYVPASPIYDWDFTSSMVDSVGGKTAITTGTQDSSGVTFSDTSKYIAFDGVYAKDRTYEIDVDSIVKTIANDYGRLWMVDADANTTQGGSGYIITGTKKGGDIFYMNGSWESSVIVDKTTDSNGSYYSNSTVGFYVDNSGYVSVYKDGTLLGTSSTALSSDYDGKNVYIGSSLTDYLPNATFTGFRVYEGNIYS